MPNDKQDPADKVDDTKTDPPKQEEEVSLLDAMKEAIEDDSTIVDESEEDDSPPAKTEPDKTDEPDPAKAAEAADPAKDAADPAKATKPERDEAVEKEIKALGIKSEGAQERFRGMAGTIKTLSQEVDTLRGSHQALEQWQGALKSTKATPEDVGSALEILHHANTGTIEGAKQALAMVDEFRANLAQRFGIDIAGVDHLQGFDDLKEQVRTGDLTAAGAREIATARRLQTTQQQQRKQQEDQDAHQTAVTNAGREVDSLCAQLKANDPLYSQKFALVKPLIEVIARTVPPAQWKPTFKAYYDNVQLPTVTDTRTASKDDPQPIRRSAGGGGAATPGSMEDAVRQALGVG